MESSSKKRPMEDDFVIPPPTKISSNDDSEDYGTIEEEYAAIKKRGFKTEELRDDAFKFSDVEGKDGEDNASVDNNSDDEDGLVAQDSDDEIDENGNIVEKIHHKTVRHITGIQGEEDDTHDVTKHLQKDDLDKETIGIESFNIKNDREDGYFDEDGNYVFNTKKDRKRDSDDEPDEWVENLKDDDIYHEDPAKVNNEKDDLSYGMCLVTLLRYVQRGESVMNALKRTAPRKQPIKKQNKHKPAFLNVEVVDTSDPRAFSRITDCATILINEIPNIYQYTYERIQANIKMNTATKNRQWEYYWTNIQDKTIYGPYNTQMMIDWFIQGCFDANPMIRQYTVPKEKLEKPETQEKPSSSLADEFADAFSNDDTNKEEDEEETKNEGIPKPWIPAKYIDFFKEY
ncbi:hypothetical protein WA158_007896 [Blastocystis sp. Blastoise]